ncbi:MAG TPA: SPOR domain-containing protein [Noviherbaspirillum sp.]|nr:SPOR domain-containing protein [Noviherbaspirillum sp.]
MLRFFFWILVLANAALFGYQRGYFEFWLPSGHEPARTGRQLNADKIKLVAAPAPSPAAVPAAPAVETGATPAAETAATDVAQQAAPVAAAVPEPPAPPPEKKKPVVVACTEIGNFGPEDAKRFSAQLAPLSFAGRVEQRPVREVTSHIVYIPPQADRESAEKKAEELRGLGIADFFIIQDNSNLRWGISLGVFKTDEAAHTHLASLTQKGVRSARVAERTATLVAFRVRGLEAEQKAALERIKAKFPKQEIRRCEPA